jgi:sugar/nucleoside kinase (ribokinase family)
MPLAECGRLASLAAAEVIAHVGARPQTDLAALLQLKKAV